MGLLVEAREDRAHAGVVPDPVEGPGGRAPLDAGRGDRLGDLGRQPPGEGAAAQGLHHHDAEALRRRVLESLAAGLVMLVHVVVLDLAEVPGIVVRPPS